MPIDPTYVDLTVLADQQLLALKLREQFALAYQRHAILNRDTVIEMLSGATSDAFVQTLEGLGGIRVAYDDVTGRLNVYIPLAGSFANQS